MVRSLSFVLNITNQRKVERLSLVSVVNKIRDGMITAITNTIIIPRHLAAEIKSS